MGIDIDQSDGMSKTKDEPSPIRYIHTGSVLRSGADVNIYPGQSKVEFVSLVPTNPNNRTRLPL